jgi:GWxTD domain-containing protein
MARATDLNSRISLQKKVNIQVNDYSKNEIGISGIVFLQEAEIDSSGQLTKFEPTVGNNFELRSGYFYVYSDLFVLEPPKNISLNYKLDSENGDTELDTTLNFMVSQNVIPRIFKIEKGNYAKNRYILKITASTGKFKTEASQKFSFFWSNVPDTDDDIDIALQEMRYILNPDSLDKYEDASLEDKKTFFIKFWEERNPDPSTSINKLKDEYFRRVNYANKHFSAFGQEGWKTDRGRILIKFGFPDDVERYPFEMGTYPYEVWKYYAERKVFLFEDRTGFGDFRLHPNYINMEFQ